MVACDLVSLSMDGVALPSALVSLLLPETEACFWASLLAVSAVSEIKFNKAKLISLEF